MPMTIAQRRLANQGLATRPFADPASAVQALGAVQAQDYAGSKWSIGMRVPDATDAAIERAYAEGALLRTHLLRPTWHFVHPSDIHWLLGLTAPRVHARNATYYRRLGLDQAIIRRSAAALTRACQGGRHLTREEVRGALEVAGIPTAGTLVLSYLLMHLELDGVLCSGARIGKQHTYALLEERVPAQRRRTPADPAGELARRFFLTRGPASAQDFAKWSGLTVTAARRALAAVADGLERHAGEDLWGPPGTPDAAGAPTAHLLLIYDEYISSYADRSAMVAPPDAARLQALDNNLTGIVALDGRVVGTWKRTLGKAGVAVAPDLFRQLEPQEHAALAQAIDRYATFVELPLVAV